MEIINSNNHILNQKLVNITKIFIKEQIKLRKSKTKISKIFKLYNIKEINKNIHATFITKPITKNNLIIRIYYNDGWDMLSCQTIFDDEIKQLINKEKDCQNIRFIKHPMVKQLLLFHDMKIIQKTITDKILLELLEEYDQVNYEKYRLLYY